VNALALRSVSLFVDVPEAELALLAGRLRRRRYARGQIIFTQGDPGTNLCLVEEGRVRISVASDDGKELVLRMLGPGDFFGELALLDGEPRSADAIAHEPCVLLLLPREEFLAFLDERPGVAALLLAALSRKLRVTTQQAQEVAFLDVPSRLARALLGVAGPGDPPVCRLTQSELAGLVGTTRESVNKWLGQFERRGLVSRRRGAITLLDRAGLQRQG
jgi:CRP/FNR family cyclic AMP-dependent transcriptional regulator